MTWPDFHAQGRARIPGWEETVTKPEAQARGTFRNDFAAILLQSPLGPEVLHYIVTTPGVYEELDLALRVTYAGRESEAAVQLIRLEHIVERLYADSMKRMKLIAALKEEKIRLENKLADMVGAPPEPVRVGETIHVRKPMRFTKPTFHTSYVGKP